MRAAAKGGDGRKAKASTPHDAEATRERFVEAVGKVLRRDGLRGLGVNAVARAAGRDKVLLYKYFGGLEGLYAEYTRKHPLFPTLEEMLGADRERVDSMSPLELARAAASGYLREIRKRPLTLEILRWELEVSNPLTDALSRVRQATTEEFNRRMGPQSDLDVQALTSLMYGGIVYLLLKSRTGTVFNGMDLQHEEAWVRMEKALHRFLERMLA